MKKSAFLLVYLILSSYLNGSFIAVLPLVSAQENVVFFDDFNDNALDTGKWSEDLVGSGNAYAEENGEAHFTTYGHRTGSYTTEHAFLKSKNIEISDWSSVTFSGRWKFADPGTAEMWFRVYDPDTGKYIGVRYVSWTRTIAYDRPEGTVSDSRNAPQTYVSFRIVLYRDHFEYWEGGTLVKAVPTAGMENTTGFYLLIGGWDDTPTDSHIYFDDIAVEYSGGSEAPLKITITSPEEGVYNTTQLWLNVTSNKPVDEWRYSLNGAGNVTFEPNTTIEAVEGENSLTVYATAGNETASARVSFYVDTTPPGTVENLTHEVGTDYIRWKWGNPKDEDFSAVLVYIDGKFQGKTGGEEWLLEELSPGETHTIGLLTEDRNGNINTTWVNDTATTLVPSERVYVNESGWWYEGGTFNPSESPLGDGINAAPAGGIVVVMAGNYTESVEVDKPLTLEARTGVVLRGDGSKRGYYRPVILINSNNVTVSGFTLNSSLSNVGIWANSSHNCLLMNNTIAITESSEDERYGVYLSHGTNNTARNNTVVVEGFQGTGVYVYYEGGSIIEGNWVNVTGDGSSGIEVFYSKARVKDNEVQLSGIAENPGYGLYLYLAGDSSVENNGITTNLSEGNSWAINVVGAFNGSLAGNVINGIKTEVVSPGDFMIRGVPPENRPAPPEGYGSVGIYLEVQMDWWTKVGVYYNDSAIKGLREDSLAMWNFLEGWSRDGISEDELDTAGNFISANVTVNGILAPLAQEERDTTPPVLTFVSPTPENGSLIGNSTVVVNITASEDLSSATLELDGTNHTMSGSGRQWWYSMVLPDGRHSLTVYGSDLAGNEGKSGTLTFEVDTTAPVYVLYGQSREGIPPGESVVLHSLWSDEHLSYSLLWTNVTGSWEVFDEEPFVDSWANFTISLDEPGTYCWYVEAFDELEHSNKTPVECFEVYSPPRIVSYSPETPVESYVGEDVEFSVIFDQVVNVKWYLREEIVKNETGVNSSDYATSTLPPGEYSLRVIATNDNGSVSHSWAWYIYERPSLSITFVHPTPENGAMLNVRRVFINVSSSVELENATLEWNGINESMSGSGKSWWTLKDNLPDGSYSFRVYGRSGDLENSTEIRTVTIDATPPGVLFYGESNEVVIEGDSVRIFAKWLDEHLSSAVLWTNASEGFEWTETPLEIRDGWSNWTIETGEDFAGKTFCWYIVANDTFGNENETETLCFRVEERLKIVTFEPEAEEVTLWDNESASFSVELNKEANVSWFVNESLVLSERGTESVYTNSSLVPGMWNVSVRAERGNESVAHWWILHVREVDRTPPSLWFVSPTPENGSILNFRTVEFRVNASERLISATLRSNDSRFDLNAMSYQDGYWSVSLTLPDGEYTFYVEGIDFSGNRGTTENRSITIDTKPPLVIFVDPTPQNDSLVKSCTMTIKVNTSEDLMEAVLEFDGTNYTMEFSEGLWDYSGALCSEDGLHSFRVYGTDQAGNSNSTEVRTITVDATPPKILWVHALNMTEIEENIYLAERLTYAGFLFNISDTHPGSYAVSTRSDLQTPWEILLSGTYLSGVPVGFRVSTEDVGLRFYHVVISDAAGNFISMDYAVNVSDTTPPGEIINPSIETDSSGFEITWTNPYDEDFHHVELYLDPKVRKGEKGEEIIEWDGAFLANISGSPGENMSYSRNAAHGAHTLYIRTVDSYGNRGNFTQIKFTIPLPQFNLSYTKPTPQNGSILPSKTDSVSISVVSSVELRSCVLLLNGEEIPMKTSGKTCNAEINVIPGGNYTFYVKATDIYMRTKETSPWGFFVERTCLSKEASLKILSPLKDPNSLIFPVRFVLKTNSLPRGYIYRVAVGDKNIEDIFKPDFKVVGIEKGKDGSIYTVNASFLLNLWEFRKIVNEAYGGKSLELNLRITAFDSCGRGIEDHVITKLCGNATPPDFKVNLNGFYYSDDEILLGISSNDTIARRYYSINYGNWVEFNETANLTGMLKPGTNFVRVLALGPCGLETLKNMDVFLGPPKRGDWVVNTTVECYDHDFNVNGSLLIDKTGRLFLKRCKIHVKGSTQVNGTLNVLDDSLVQSALGLEGYGGELRVVESSIESMEKGILSEGDVEIARALLKGEFYFDIGNLSIDSSLIMGGIEASGSVKVINASFVSGSGLMLVNPLQELRVEDVLSRDCDYGLHLVNDSGNFFLKNIQVENAREAGVFVDHWFGELTFSNLTIENSEVGAKISGAEVSFEYSTINSSSDTSLWINAAGRMITLKNSSVGGIRALHAATISLQDTNVTGDVLGDIGILEVKVSPSVKAFMRGGKAKEIDAEVWGTLSFTSYSIEGGSVVVNAGGMVEIEDSDGIPATEKDDKDASLFRNVRIQEFSGEKPAQLTVLDSKLKNSTLITDSRWFLIKGSVVEGGLLSFNSGEDALEVGINESRPIGEFSEWYYSILMPSAGWYYQPDYSGMVLGHQPFVMDEGSKPLMWPVGTEFGSSPTLYLKKILSIDKIPLEAEFNYEAVGSVVIYVNGRKVKEDFTGTPSFRTIPVLNEIHGIPASGSVDLAPYLIPGKNVIAVVLKIPVSYPYLRIGAFRARLMMRSGIAGITDSILRTKIDGYGTRAVFARDEIYGNLSFGYLSWVKVSSSKIVGSINVLGKVEVIDSELMGSGTGKGINTLPQYGWVTVKNSTISNFAVGISTNNYLEVLSSEIAHNDVGIHVENAQVEIKGSYIMNNSLGVEARNVTGKIENNVVYGNSVGISHTLDYPKMSSLSIDRNTITGNGIGARFVGKSSPEDFVGITRNIIQNNDLGLFFNTSLSPKIVNNSLVNEKGVYIAGRFGVKLQNTDWGGHVPRRVKSYTDGIMYTEDGNESESYDILDKSWQTLWTLGNASRDWGSDLLSAFLDVYPTENGKVKGTISIRGIAISKNGVVNVRYYLMYRGNKTLLGEWGGNEQSYDDYILLDTVEKNLTGDGTIEFVARDSKGRTLRAFRRVRFANADIIIANISATNATNIYTLYRVEYATAEDGTKYPAKWIPYRGRFANVSIELRNLGILDGTVWVEVDLPDYIERHTGKMKIPLTVPANSSGTLELSIPLTSYDWGTLTWDPLPEEFPDVGKFTAVVRLYTLENELLSEKSVEIGFDFGPVFKITNYITYPYSRAFCESFPDSCHQFGDEPPYDGDGDDVVEAAESHHFSLGIKNIGDEKADLISIEVSDHVPEKYKGSKVMKSNSAYIQSGAPALKDVYALTWNLLGEINPEEEKSARNLWMDWWHDAPPVIIPPVNYTGHYITNAYFLYHIGFGEDVYYTPSLNFKRTPVKALNKTFVVQTVFMDPIEVTVRAVRNGKTYVELENTNDNVYYDYYVDGYYGPYGGYKWYHILPPGYSMRAIADHSLEPNKVIPHYRIIVGAKPSLIGNEFEVVATTVEGILKASGVNVPVKLIATAIGKTAIKLINIAETLDFETESESFEDLANGSRRQEFEASLKASNQTMIVPVDVDDVIRWEKNYGMDRNFYSDFKNIDQQSLGRIADLSLTFGKAVIMDEDLRMLLIESLIEATDKDLYYSIFKMVRDIYQGNTWGAVGGAEDIASSQLKDKLKKEAKKKVLEELKKSAKYKLAKPEEQEEMEKETANGVAALVTTTFELSQFVTYVALAPVPGSKTIYVLDPPGNYTVRAEEKDRMILFGGTGGNGLGEGNISLTLGKKGVYRANYTALTATLPIGSLFNGTLEWVNIVVKGTRTDKMTGSVRMTMRASPEKAPAILTVLRDKSFAKLLVGRYFNEITELNVTLNNGVATIDAVGELSALPEDEKVSMNISIDSVFLKANIERIGRYENAEISPAFGLSLNRTSVSVRGGKKAVAGKNEVLVVSSEAKEIKLEVTPRTLSIGSSFRIESSAPCYLRWRIGEIKGEGNSVPTDELTPGNYTLSVECISGENKTKEDFSVEVLPKPLVPKKLDGALVELSPGRRSIFEFGTDLYMLSFIAKNEIKGVVAVHQITGKLQAPEGYTYVTYAIFNVTHPSNWSIGNATLYFRIPREWLARNNVSSESVLLLHYRNGWEEHRPTFDHEDSKYVYYFARVQGLSLFAVATKVKIKPSESTSEGEGELTESQTTVSPSPSSTAETQPQPSKKNNVLLYSIGALLLLAILAYVLIRKT